VDAHLISKIEGLVLTPLRQIADDRGAVLHMLRNDAPEFTDFGECYFSEVMPGAVKAWKRHKIQTQNFAVPMGHIRLVIYDDREDSGSRDQLQIVNLGRPEFYLRVQIPPGLWYGFTCTSDEPALLVNCADIPHDTSEGETVPADHAAIPYQWDDRSGLGGR
jgi:dTDP-4-dehydrorhamnose 3,5-epimerase